MITSPVTVSRAPQLTTFTTAGPYSYTIPTWCSHIDIVVLGGGGGGRDGNGAVGLVGNGGTQGAWNTRTIERGVNIPWSATTITGTVGAGGAAGAKGAGNVLTTSRGGTTTAIYASTTFVGSGGDGGNGTLGQDGGSPGTITYNTINYSGGGTSPSGASRTIGKAPGGGGGGGAGGIFNGQTAGMAGAAGAAYFYAYTKAKSPPSLSKFTNALNVSSMFNIHSSGSGIIFSVGEVLWNGTGEGQAIALYTKQATSDNQYASAIVGTQIAGAAAAIILHSDAGYTGYYAFAFHTSKITLMRTSGRWNQNAYTTLIDYAVSVTPGSFLEFWNIGATFYMAVNGTTYITHTISNPVIDKDHRYQGIGLFRTTTISSARITEWQGGDAAAWGKS